MGISSKPLAIMIDRSVYDANELGWLSLQEQGHQISVLLQPLGDIVLAPYAMRMTGDMLVQLPSAFTLAVKGARELRYGSTTKGSTTWKGAKGAHDQKARARKNSTVKAQAVSRATSLQGAGEPPTPPAHQGTGGIAVSPVSDTTHVTRPEEPTPIGRTA